MYAHPLPDRPPIIIPYLDFEEYDIQDVICKMNEKAMECIINTILLDNTILYDSEANKGVFTHDVLTVVANFFDFKTLVVGPTAVGFDVPLGVELFQLSSQEYNMMKEFYIRQGGYIQDTDKEIFLAMATPSLIAPVHTPLTYGRNRYRMRVGFGCTNTQSLVRGTY